MLQKLLFLTLAGLLSFASSAQRIVSSDSVANTTVRDIVKINMASLPLKNVSVQYEYIVKKKLSLAFGVRVMPTSAIPAEDAILRLVAKNNGHANSKALVRVSRIGNIAITPELRFYLDKGYGQGLYIAPYYRFSSFTSNTLILNYTEANGPKRTMTMNGEMTAHSAGAMMGAQWFLGRHFVIDWWIAGAHFGVANGKFIGVPATELSTGEQADVRYTLDNIDIPLVSKTTTVAAAEVETKFDGSFGGLRAGILVGIRF
jgi:hypothetical protein